MKPDDKIKRHAAALYADACAVAPLYYAGLLTRAGNDPVKLRMVALEMLADIERLSKIEGAVAGKDALAVYDRAKGTAAMKAKGAATRDAIASQLDDAARDVDPRALVKAVAIDTRTSERTVRRVRKR